jgi:hypothetical protein
MLTAQAAKGNIRYLDALPKEFTKEDLEPYASPTTNRLW